MSNVTTVPLLTDLQGPWATLRLEILGPGAPGVTVTLPDIYPIQSIQEFKRRLWLFQKGDPRWAPERVFLGVQDAANPTQIRPIEFYWPTAAEPTLADPVTAARVPASLLVDAAGNRKPVQPKMVGTLLLEDSIKPTDTVIAICLAALTADLTPEVLTPALFTGFYQLYFPWLTSPAQVLDAGLTTLSKADAEAYAITVPYLEDRTGRMGIVQGALARGVGGAVMSMSTMVRLRWLLPPPISRPESLEKTFYGLSATPTIPFLRYFPAEGSAQGISPLLKLALQPDGNPVLSDPTILTAYLNQPAPNRRTAVILARVPIRSAHAAPGAAFTIHMFEDGVSDIVFEVPQRGATYIAAVATEAQRLLREVMTAVGFDATEEPRLEELFATYRWSHPTPKTASPLTTEILRRRVRALTPFLDPAPLTTDETALAAFQWRAVSNYEAESAQFAYITQMVLRAEKEGPIAADPAAAHDAYLSDIATKFGLTTDQAALLLERWMERRGEAVAPAPGQAAGMKAVAAHSTGTRIAISGTHPEYAVEIQGASSMRELQRIVSVIGILLGASSKELTLAPPTKAVQMLTQMVTAKEEATATSAAGGAAAAGVSTVEESLAGVEELDPAMADLLADLGFDFGGDAEEGTGEEEAAPELLEAPVEEAATMATTGGGGVSESKEEIEEECRANPWTAGEPALRPKPDWYMARLKKEDIRMFGFKSTATGRIKSYSKSCQRRDDRQPNIMTQAEYNRVLRCYEDRVRFVNLPPRRPEDLPQDPTYNPKIRNEDDYFLTDPQTGKPLWSVYNYENKSFPGQRMYLMCAELWCERDNLPLLRAEFEGTEGRGFTKPVNTCPFCAGRPFASLATPVPGESVIVRLPKAATGRLHTFIGTITRNKHPEGYSLPCCDTTPRLLRKYMLAAAMHQLTWGRELGDDEEEEEGVGAIKAGGAAATGAATLEEGRLAIEATLEKAAVEAEAEGKIAALPEEEAHVDYAQRLRTIRTQYILAPDKALGPGKFGMLPPMLDAFFGQSSPAAMEARGIARSFREGTTVFVRLGVDTRTKARGLNLFAGLAPLLGHESAEETQRAFLSLRAVRAFEAANYGTLLHEFAARPGPPQADLERTLREFAAEFGYPTDVESRPHVLRVYRAWTAYLAYLNNKQEPKQLRHIEHLLAQPGIVLPTGLLLVVLEEVDGKIQVACPSFGIPPSSAYTDVPVSFVWHDRRDDSWEPLILYNDSPTAGTRHSLFRFGDRTPEIDALPKDMRAQMAAWIRNWRSSSKGCGRGKPAPHVWTPDRDTAGIPRLLELLRTGDKYGVAVKKIVRDRSNRLVGVLTAEDLFIPCLDDGTLLTRGATVYEATGIPPKPLTEYLALYNTLGGTDTGPYKALRPTHAVAKISDKTIIVGFQTAVGTFVPVAPEPLGASPPLPIQEVYEFPWERDNHILRAPDAPTITVTAMEETLAPIDEQLAEAYQHLRLSFSRWLHRDAQAPAFRREIEKILTSSLPLYERRKRMDILLEPRIRTMVELTPAAATDRKALSLLRQDCLSLPESDCAAAGACRWSGGRCLIHAPTVAPTDPIRIFTARLSDEVLRYAIRRRELLEETVPEIRVPRGVVRIGNELYMATRHKEAATSILERLGFTGTMEMRFPEEMLRFDGLEEEADALTVAAADAGGAPIIAEYTNDKLPAHWLAMGYELPAPLPDLPDPRGAAFYAGTGKGIAYWSSIVQISKYRSAKGDFNWSLRDMYALASVMKLNILYIQDGRIRLWIAPPENKKTGEEFILFWGPLELLLTKNKRWILKKVDFPVDLLQLLDASSPANPKELLAPPAEVRAGGAAAGAAATSSVA